MKRLLITLGLIVALLVPLGAAQHDRSALAANGQAALPADPPRPRYTITE